MNSSRKGLRAAVLGVTVGGGLLSGLVACVPEPQQPLFYESMARPDAVVDQATAAQMISQYRANEGAGAIRPDRDLFKIALQQSEAMARGGSVKASLAKDMRLAKRMASIGEPETYAVENVSGGYRTLAEAFSGWRDSPKHKAVMLDPKAQRFGLATAYSPGAKHRVFWTLVMAGPKGPVAAQASDVTERAGPAPKPGS
ncbi:MAG: CAP domain-containing protein [Rhodobacteraceae bacterium]|nr:CAP domain-containing protein [Paracoccaceae bacterium]